MGEQILLTNTLYILYILYYYLACEFGYYGLGCNKECSTFCKRARDCYPASGYCKDGCKSGWQGLDCLEGQYLIRASNKQLHY